ncbi:MAG: AsmA family protein [Kiritimatiellales bacterium]|nr:AsmA family protein [Kiritimatiellales bacterium]
MKKVLSIIGIVILVFVVVLVLFLGQIIKAGIETAGPKIAGVPMTVEKVRVNPLTGKVHVRALIIGNPEGFKTDSLMELGEFKLDIALGSLFTDTILIKQILIDAPEITYEKGLRSSNISTLLDNLAPEEQPEEKVTDEPKKEKKAPAKKVVIEDFQLNSARVHVTLVALGGKKMTLPLPSIQMQDIGKDSGGTDIKEVISEVFGSISDAVVKALASSGDFAGDALKDAGGAVKDVGGAATDAAKDAAGALKKGIGGLFGKE